MPVIRFIFPDNSDGNMKCHLGTAYIIAYLKANGRLSDQFVSLAPPALPDLTKLILNGQPKAIGFTCLSSNVHLVKLLAGSIKQVRPDIMIIAGGPSATFSDSELLGEVPEIDVCVRGEGEVAALELADHIENGKSLAAIKGISYRYKDRIVRNPDRALMSGKVNGLDVFPSPYLTGILRPADMLEHYHSVMLVTTRGCAQKCSYCSCAAISRNKVRCHSIERVIGELKFIEGLQGHEKNFIVHLMDDAFTFDRKRTRELCRRIITEKIKLELWCDTRADYVDEDLLKLMREAGLRRITFGLESAVPKVLYAMRKARSGGAKDCFRPEKRFLASIRERVKQAKAIGLDVKINALFGFPGESFKDGLKTLAFISKMDVNLYAHNNLSVYPGTELFDRLKAKKRASAARPGTLGVRSYSEYDLSALPALHNKYARGMSVNNLCALEQALTGASVQALVQPQYLITATADMPLDWVFSNLSLRTNIVPWFKAPERLVNAEFLKPCHALAEILPELIRRNERPSAEPAAGGRPAVRRERPEGSRSGPKLVFDIVDGKDLADIQGRMASQSSASVPADTLVNLIMLDACRWFADCPAAGMDRLFLDGEGNIRPCSAGPVLGCAGATLGNAARAMSGLRARTQAERGCASCAVKDNCSKCAALGSVKPEVYCEIMRSRAGVVKFAAVTKAANMLNYVSYLRYLQTTDETGAAGPQ